VNRARIAMIALPVAVFLAVGVVVSVLRHNAAYLALFALMGAAGAACSQAHRVLGRRVLLFRRALHWGLSLFFFIYLMMIVGVNFHLSQVFFDAMAWVVTGALIQLVVARVLLPFFFGNGFCSTCCWNGAVFDLLPRRGRRRLPAWTRWLPYAVIPATLGIAFLFRLGGVDPVEHLAVRRNWMLAENGVIFLVGIGLAPAFGGRLYCRAVCPLRAISRLFARYSAVKIGLKEGAACRRCGACEAACPFEVPVARYVGVGQRVIARDCTLCEKCVAACPDGSLALTLGRPWA